MAEQAQYLGTGKRKTSVARVILRPGGREDVVQRADARGLLPARRTGRCARAAEDRRRRGNVRHPRPRPRRRSVRTGRRRASRNRPRARRGRPGAAGAAQARGLSSPATPASSSARRPASTRPARRHSSGSDSPGLRRYFGTDGVRGVVGQDLTVDLVERLGKALVLWSGRGRPSSAATPAAPALSSRTRSRAVSWRPAGTPCSPACSRRPRWRCSRSTSASSSRPRTTRPNTTASSSSTSTAASRTDASEEEIEALLDARKGWRVSSTASASTPTAISTTSRALRHRPQRPPDRRRLRQRRLCRDRPGRVLRVSPR